MPALQYLLIVLLCLCTVTQPNDFTSFSATAQQPATTNPLTYFAPLPKSCSGGLPAGASVPTSCMFGYVFIDGKAVDGAKVTITSQRGTIEEWTSSGPDSTQPYFRTSLSDLPLMAHADETVAIVAEYSGHRHTITHHVLAGGQQVDVVLPRTQINDYVFERQIWTQAPAARFNGISDVAVDAVGKVFVVDSVNARIQVFDSNGQFLFQWGSKGNQPGQFARPTGIAFDTTGNAYVSDGSNHNIQKFSNVGTWITSWGGYGSGNGEFSYPEGLTVSKDNIVYVADSWNNRIQKFDNTGNWLATFGSGVLYGPQGISAGNNGDVYVTDTFNHKVRRYTQDGVLLTTWGGVGEDNGQFRYSDNVTVDTNNNIYVSDWGNNRIQKFNDSGTWLSTWGTYGSGDGQFNEPKGIAASKTGDLYIVDTANYRIQRFNQNGRFSLAWGSQGNAIGQVDYPEGVGVSNTGNIYIPDSIDEGSIQKYSSSGQWLESWGSRGSGTGQFNHPRKVAIDKSGNVFIADAGNARVQKFSSDGQRLVSWGSFGSNAGQFDTRSYGMGIGIDNDGNVYIADTGNNRIQKFTNNGIWLNTWGEYGSNDAQFNAPRGIAIDQNNTVYVADTDNSRVQKFSSSGTWLATWGGFGSGNSQFKAASAISVGPDGYVYVADLWNSRIHKFTSSGAWQSSWGVPGGGDGQFDRPEGIALGTDSRLYVADSGNHRIQILQPMTYTRPIATIVAATANSVVQGQPVELVGMGGDSDATTALAGYEWTLDGTATPFGTTANISLPTTGLAPGRHTISFRVRDTEGEWSETQNQTIDVSAVATPAHETWTFLLYLAGDNSNTALFMNRNTQLGALYRLEHTTPNPNVRVVALYDGDYPGGGDSFRYIQQPNGQFLQEPLGEVNMGDPQTLIDFVRWGQQQAPADHYYLAIADHANALDGIAWDFTSARTEHLTNGELRQALGAATEQGARPIDVLHLDGCLMGLIENAYQMRGLARYLVASENLSWSAFAYDYYRAAVDETTSPRELASVVADRYAERVGSQSYPYTITAFDLAGVDAMTQATDVLAGELLRFALATPANRELLLSLRGQAQKFDSSGNYVITADDEYVDIQHWATLIVAGVNDAGVQLAANAMLQALPSLILREHHASGTIVLDTNIAVNLDEARGVAIYYPARTSVKTYQTYVRGDLNFPTDTRWDEFLAAGLAALPFDSSDPVQSPVPPLPWNPVVDPPASLQHTLYLPTIVR